MISILRKLFKFLILITSLFLFTRLICNFYQVENKNVNTFPIVFYKDAYVDLRMSPPKLRVFSLNHCLINGSFLIIRFEDYKQENIKMLGEPIEADCPWSWAPNCYYSSHVFEVSLYNVPLEELLKIRKVNILINGKVIDLNIKQVMPKLKDGLTICVQPVYWYNQFQNIILFIESWRNQGASHFIVYFHSSTKEVKMVLDHYQKLGILTIMPWPTFGTLPTQFPNINSQVYRVGHNLAANLCVLEMKTTLGSIVDFDELIVPKNGYSSVLALSIQKLGQENVGALEFENTRVQLDLSNDKTGFDTSSLKNPALVDKKGPPKLIFKTSSIEIILTHSVRKFIKTTDRTLKVAHGTLIHYRYNGGKLLSKKMKDFSIFDGHNFDGHIENMKNTTKIIFGVGQSIFKSEIIWKLNECIEEIKAANICRSTVTFCKSRMENIASWEIHRTPGIFKF